MSMRPRHAERGAIAVVFAICAALLFSVAALGVDLGNAFNRKRQTQTQADFAALAAGADLPATKSADDPAVIAVADYLISNAPHDDSGATLPSEAQLAANLVNGDDSDGEVYLPSTTKMRLVTPRATVDFGLAAVMGFSKTRVAAEATVELRSPGKPLPFMLPESCTTGDFELKDGTPASASGPVSFSPASDSGGGVAKVDSIAPLTVPGGATSTLTIYGKNFTAPLTVDYFLANTMDRFPATPTASFPATKAADSGGENVATTDLPADVYNRPGTWYVRIRNATTGYSKSYGTFKVGDPTPPPAGCGMTSTGDFGQIDSPRKGTPAPTLDEATALNIAKGLDHNLALFPYPTYSYPTGSKDTCNGLGGTVPPGAVNDKDPNVDGANCVDIKTGMNTNADTEGLITGNPPAYAGLLDQPTTPGCDPSGGSAQVPVLGVNINDDVLSCFLPPGVTVGAVSGPSVTGAALHSISSKIYQSPRFGVVPVIKFGVNPQNGFYPIEKFQPIFITDESGPSMHGTSYATSQNGILTNGTKVVAVKVVAINPDALPDTADVDGPTIPWLGSGTKVVQLVN